MHPRKLLPVVDPLAVLDAAAELDVLADVLLVALDELLPQAAISRVAAPAATVAISVVCLNVFPLQDQIADAQA
jgi:hypothetical protein